MTQRLRIGVITSGKFHYNAGAVIQAALVRQGSYHENEFIGLTHDAGPEVIKYLEGGTGSFYDWAGVDDLSKLLVSCKVTHLLSDDFYPRLRVAAKASRRADIEYVVYAHVLRGFAAISRARPHAESAWAEASFFAGSLAPFRALTHNYVELLSGARQVLPNSGFTQALLAGLYGVVSGPIAYPAVDREFLREQPSTSPAREGSFAIYFGNKGELSDRNLVALALQCQQKGLTLGEGFGDPEAAGIFKKSFPGTFVTHSESLLGSDLANILSKSSVTIAPQTNEMFGLVGPESILCGTPVLLTNYQPWLEITGPGSFCGLLWDRTPGPLRPWNSTEAKNDLPSARRKLREKLSPESLASRLLSAISPP